MRLLSCLLVFSLPACAPPTEPTPAKAAAVPVPVPAATAPTPVATASPLVAAARAQIGQCVTYDPAYVRLKYPMGDVPADRGVCSDVVIRALRTAHGKDLQALVHEDMRAHFAEYPKLWGLQKTDAHIDHRRVPNLETWMRRQGWALPASAALLPGDIVTCRLSGRLPHIMIVADPPGAPGGLRVLHNIGNGTREEVAGFEMTGRFRVR